MTQMNLCAKQRLTENRLMVAKEEGVGGMEEGDMMEGGVELHTWGRRGQTDWVGT